MCEAAALKNLLGLAYCCLPPLAISAWVQKPGQVPGEHLAFCCEEGRIRKSNAPVDWDPRGDGKAFGAWQRLGHILGCLPILRLLQGGMGWPGARRKPHCLYHTLQRDPWVLSPGGSEPAEGRWVEEVPAWEGHWMPGGGVSSAKWKVSGVMVVSHFLHTKTPHLFGIIRE